MPLNCTVWYLGRPRNSYPLSQFAKGPRSPNSRERNIPYGFHRAAQAPNRLIELGLPGPHLLAQLITSKFLDHLPLYRQQQPTRATAWSSTRARCAICWGG